MVAYQMSAVMNKPIHKILFGSPGTGKSHRIVSEIIPNYLGIDEFFQKIYPAGVIRTQLSYSKLITEEDFKDFNKVRISYFYENLFHDLERSSDGKLELKIKWSITFDERCTPIQLANLPPNYRGYEHKLSSKDVKSRKYGIIEINRIPVFYYIYFTLKEILDIAKHIKT
ncbi:MAG: hypothetical protein V7K77_11820 [Nostoc sp.]|uniref:hypothetical protein n=1 Tax=Nostoc sp. TaxID=1180 RepID=UPI002FF5C4F3